MVSAIDVTKPIYGEPTTESVRTNFGAAHDEITSLQDFVTTLLPKSGGKMTGMLTLYGPPLNNNDAATLAWTLSQIHSTINTLIYVGDYDAAADRILTSGQPQFVVGQPLPPASSATTQYYFTVKTGNTTSIGNQPPGGVPASSWLISNGVSWNVYIMSMQGITAQNVVVNPAIPNVAGSDVYNALTSIGANFLMKSGGTMTGDLLLNRNPALTLGAATKGYVDAALLAGFATRIDEAPKNLFAHARFMEGWTDGPIFSKVEIYQKGDLEPYLKLSSEPGKINSIEGAKTDSKIWDIQLGDANGDLSIVRYNDNAVAYDGGLPALAINRAVGDIWIAHNLVFNSLPELIPSIFGRYNTNPTNPANDTFNIWARNINGVGAGGVIGLRGPTFTNPNSVEIFTGVPNKYKQWTFLQGGELINPGPVIIPKEAYLAFDREVQTYMTKGAGNAWALMANRDWRFWFSPDGSWVWDGYPNFERKMSVDAGGNFYARGGLNTDGGLYVRGGVNLGECDVTVKTLQAFDYAVFYSWIMNNSGTFYVAGDYTTYLAYSNGNWYNVNQNRAFWILRGQTDWLAYNNVGPVGGFGDYQNYSDERGKENIAQAYVGLWEVLKLKPISFNRINTAIPELGFSAQQVKDILPQAVKPIGIILPDGSGGLDSDDPTLSVTITPIVVAIVNAIKEICVRLETIERKLQ